MSDAVWTALVNNIVPAITAVGVVVLGVYTIRAQGCLNKMAEVQNVTHDLVNSDKGVALHLTARVARKLAIETQDPKDIALAEEAERLSEAHGANQAKMNAEKEK